MSRPWMLHLRASALLAALPLVVSLLTAPAVGAVSGQVPRARLWIVIPGVPGGRAVVGRLRATRDVIVVGPTLEDR